MQDINKMSYAKAKKNAPVCDKCDQKKTIIGCGGGKWIFSCIPCTRESIRRIFEELC